MSIKELSNTMNEEKVRKEAAVALFNALGPKHIATAEAYCALGDIALEKVGEEYLKEAYDYYKKAYEGFSAYYKDSLILDNLEFIYTYFLLCDTNQDIDTCERLMDLYFDDISGAIIDDEQTMLEGLLKANLTEDNILSDDFDVASILNGDLDDLCDFVNEKGDKILEPDVKETYFRLFEAFLSYVIEHYQHDDTDFVTACETYDHFLPAFNEHDLVDTYTSAIIVQHYFEETDLGSALAHLEYIFANSCFGSAEEGVEIGDMLFGLVDLIVKLTKTGFPEELERLIKIGKKYKKQFGGKKPKPNETIYQFIAENFEYSNEFDD